MPTIEDAIALAVAAHRGQVDKSKKPYILHPLRVMLRMKSEEEQIIAVLHDVVEDTPYTLERLRELGYSEEILAALDCLTRREGESYQEFIERISQNPIARRVKLADLEDNMDVKRLSEVGPREAERLSRYCKAWQRLQALP